MRAYEIVAGSSSVDGLRRCDRPEPQPQPTQILVRIRAASLNFRDLAIARIRAVYRGWNRDTSVAQMREDWDTAFGGSDTPVICERVSADGVDGEWVSPANPPKVRTWPPTASRPAGWCGRRSAPAGHDRSRPPPAGPDSAR